jgi:acetylornithine aminotransferase/acetylornithine/N-succinyldiaminopimelate aminotransferase
VLEEVEGAAGFLPDGVSMAKSLGGGFPIGAFWLREPYQDLLGPGTHGTTFGGTPLGCAVANKIFEVIERDNLVNNVRTLGAWLKGELDRLGQAYPTVVKGGRGLGFMLGLELQPKEQIAAFAGSDRAASMQMADRLHEAGVLLIPSGTQIVRLLPAYNLTRHQAEEGIAILESVVRKLAGA